MGYVPAKPPPPRGIIRRENGTVVSPDEFGSGCLVSPSSMSMAQLLGVRLGWITANEGRALHGLPAILHTGQRIAPSNRWRCSYCAVIREGNECAGCGAPKSERIA